MTKAKIIVCVILVGAIASILAQYAGSALERRTWQYRVAVRMLQAHWKMGAGANGFGHLGYSYAYAMGMQDKILEEGRDKVHCEPIEAMIAFGVPAFGVMAVAILVGGWGKKDVYLWCGLLGVLAHSMIDIPLHSKLLIIVWFFVLGQRRIDE